MSSRRRSFARRNPDAALWIALGVGVVGLGVGVYFLTKSSSTSTSTTPPSNQLTTSVGPATSFLLGHTYNFTAPLNGLPINPAAISQALANVGWTNINITAVTPATYSATATWSGAQSASLPPGATATLVS